jgi:hypothetical protein
MFLGYASLPEDNSVIQPSRRAFTAFMKENSMVLEGLLGRRVGNHLEFFSTSSDSALNQGNTAVHGETTMKGVRKALALFRRLEPNKPSTQQYSF